MSIWYIFFPLQPQHAKRNNGRGNELPRPEKAKYVHRCNPQMEQDEYFGLIPFCLGLQYTHIYTHTHTHKHTHTHIHTHTQTHSDVSLSCLSLIIPLPSPLLMLLSVAVTRPPSTGAIPPSTYS